MVTTNQEKHHHKLCRALGYTFKTNELLSQALTHSSYVNERPGNSSGDNERLEFLGDAVLDLAVSSLLMEEFDWASEGLLSKLRAMVVDETGLHRVAMKLGLGDYLFLGKGEEQSGGREKPSILADSVEALMGALYLDGGFNSVFPIVRRLFMPMIKNIHLQEMSHDYKSLLQEFTQQTYRKVPKYSIVDERGPAHEKTFKVSLSLDGKVLAEAEGKSKKEAQQRAAREAYFCLKKD